MFPHSMDKKRWIMVSVGILLVLSVILYVLYPNKSEEIPFPTYPKQENLPKNKAAGTSPPSAVSTEIWVDIKGAVAKPGVYKLSSEKARMFELIRISGGLLPSADERNVNLAQTLHDGEMIMIYKKGETLVAPQPSGGTQSASAKDNPLGAEGEIVHLNTATLDQLNSLPGIGSAKASAILDYRKEHGSFRDVEELRQVKGIGDKLYEKIKEKVSIQ